MPRPKIIAIVGPTSSGKSALGVWLAKQLQKDFGGGEIISADSRQVYKGLDIGTGKVTKKEMAGVPHHLLSVANPKKQFSVDDFVKKATRAHSLIRANERISILVGGTGLYVDMFLGRMSYPNVPPNFVLRKNLENKTASQLYAMLQKLDPARAATIEKHNPRRLVSAIEIAKELGTNPPPSPEQTYDVLWLGLNPGEQVLRKKIGIRLRARIKAGMINEAKRLSKAGLSFKRMEDLGLEYRYLARFLQKKITKKEMLEQLDREIYQYSKRQMRWFKRNKDIIWVKNSASALREAKRFRLS